MNYKNKLAHWGDSIVSQNGIDQPPNHSRVAKFGHSQPTAISLEANRIAAKSRKAYKNQLKSKSTLIRIVTASTTKFERPPNTLDTVNHNHVVTSRRNYQTSKSSPIGAATASTTKFERPPTASDTVKHKNVVKLRRNHQVNSHTTTNPTASRVCDEPPINNIPYRSMSAQQLSRGEGLAQCNQRTQSNHLALEFRCDCCGHCHRFQRPWIVVNATYQYQADSTTNRPFADSVATPIHRPNAAQQGVSSDVTQQVANSFKIVANKQVTGSMREPNHPIKSSKRELPKRSDDYDHQQQQRSGRNEYQQNQIQNHGYRETSCVKHLTHELHSSRLSQSTVKPNQTAAISAAPSQQATPTTTTTALVASKFPDDNLINKNWVACHRARRGTSRSSTRLAKVVTKSTSHTTVPVQPPPSNMGSFHIDRRQNHIRDFMAPSTKTTSADLQLSSCLPTGQHHRNKSSQHHSNYKGSGMNQQMKAEISQINFMLFTFRLRSSNQLSVIARGWHTLQLMDHSAHQIADITKCSHLKLRSPESTTANPVDNQSRGQLSRQLDNIDLWWPAVHKRNQQRCQFPAIKMLTSRSLLLTDRAITKNRRTQRSSGIRGATAFPPHQSTNRIQHPPGHGGTKRHQLFSSRTHQRSQINNSCLGTSAHNNQHFLSGCFHVTSPNSSKASNNNRPEPRLVHNHQATELTIKFVNTNARQQSSGAAPCTQLIKFECNFRI